ncbi:CHAD domain-containing protein [Terracoccus luteus]|uniref:CHAD domain-containing protein n=1 Tax=Terracoccus luteus TaxID=53356 RepID=A0A839Q6S9_9MICO|nr:CHAD domain-containing protein [Terracoccus luteus]MBB2988361.1 CHAD domain-containing protein [Terracoccus luteus]MCP2174009.1 CHAD domain-containing protein [Terracoccus luteus]
MRDGADAPAGDLLRQRLREQRDRVEAADAALRAGDDPEALHDLRVAMRRVRTALATFRPLLDRSVTEPLRDELRHVSGELGRARDHEVVVERLEALLADEPEALVRGPVAERLASLTRTARSEGGAEVEATLAGTRYAAALTLLGVVADDPPLTDAATRPGRRFAKRRLAREVARVVERSDAAVALGGEHARGEALHDARKAAKRLRYAAEAMTPALPTRSRRLARRAKALQQRLGDHHDALVTRDVLLATTAEADAAGEPSFTYGRWHALEGVRAADLEAQARDEVDRLRG